MDYAGTIHDYSAISAISQTGNDTSFEGFSKVTLTHDSHCLCDTSRPAPHAASSILDQSQCPITCLAPGTVLCQSKPPLCQSCGPWTTSRLFQTGVWLGLTSRRKMVTTDASNLGWGALLEGDPAFGSWSALEQQLLHINCLEMLVVFLALKTFLPDLRGHHILVQSDSMTVVAYINHQGALRSPLPYRMARRLLWAQKKLLSLGEGSCAGQTEPGCRYAVQR